MMLHRATWIAAALYCGNVLAISFSIASSSQAKELVIAFALDNPPYVMDEGKTGIEIDIVRAALEPKGYTFRAVQMPYGELADAVASKGVDAAATVTKMDNGTYYSENYITYHNAAITKERSNITLESIADLRGKTIVAWENAYEDLGPEFRASFSPDVKAPYREKYHEIANQENQVEMFWKGEAEVIVIGKAVMQWFTRELAGEVDTTAPLVYHDIFPKNTEFRISFKSKQVRDDFDAGLEQLRKSGAYESIYKKYLK